MKPRPEADETNNTILILESKKERAEDTIKIFIDNFIHFGEDFQLKFRPNFQSIISENTNVNEVRSALFGKIIIGAIWI